jgi:hypothetical protein
MFGKLISAWKTHKARNRIRSAVVVLRGLDYAFVQAGFTRKYRRNFWRSVATDQSQLDQVLRDLSAIGPVQRPVEDINRISTGARAAGPSTPGGAMRVGKRPGGQ